MKRYAISMFWVQTLTDSTKTTELERMTLHIVPATSEEEAVGKTYLKVKDKYQAFDLRYIAKMEIPDVGDIEIPINR